MSDEQLHPPAMDVFVLEMGVGTSYMLDDDDRPGEPTIVLDISQHLGSLADSGPLRVHLAAAAVAELADVMKDTAQQSIVELAAAKLERD